MFSFSSIEEAILEIKKGKIVVVTDDEDRENEGDLVCAGRFATPENINFMASYGKGLICTPISIEICNKLNLFDMVYENTDNHNTAFTVSIDHVETTTGISAYERSLTIKKLIDEKSKPNDFRRPGHVFPLKAKEGGVLVRNGHTEATVDLCVLAGLEPVGVCCEIMDDYGKMMRTEQLLNFSKKHNLKIITIKDLIKYKNEVLK